MNKTITITNPSTISLYSSTEPGEKVRNISRKSMFKQAINNLANCIINEQPKTNGLICNYGNDNIVTEAIFNSCSSYETYLKQYNVDLTDLCCYNVRLETFGSFKSFEHSYPEEINSFQLIFVKNFFNSKRPIVLSDITNNSFGVVSQQPYYRRMRFLKEGYKTVDLTNTIKVAYNEEGNSVIFMQDEEKKQGIYMFIAPKSKHHNIADINIKHYCYRITTMFSSSGLYCVTDTRDANTREKLNFTLYNLKALGLTDLYNLYTGLQCNYKHMTKKQSDIVNRFLTLIHQPSFCEPVFTANKVKLYRNYFAKTNYNKYNKYSAVDIQADSALAEECLERSLHTAEMLANKKHKLLQNKGVECKYIKIGKYMMYFAENSYKIIATAYHTEDYGTLFITDTKCNLLPQAKKLFAIKNFGTLVKLTQNRIKTMQKMKQ